MRHLLEFIKTTRIGGFVFVLPIVAVLVGAGSGDLLRAIRRP